MEKILVTGASGYVGAYLCRKLSMRNTAEVTAVIHRKKLDYPNIRYEKCDMTNLDSVSRVFEKTKPDIVYHLASVTPSRIGKKGSDFVEYFNHLVTGQVAKLSGEYNSLLIYPSTDLVYKEGTNITEDSILEPRSVYAESKLNGEEVIESFAKKYAILRMSLVYGFTICSYESFFDLTYKNLKDNKEVTAYGDQYRHPIYVKDVIFNLLEIPGVYFENFIMNLCGDEHLSRYEMCIKMAEVYGFNRQLIKNVSCDGKEGGNCVKVLGLNNQMMHFYGLSAFNFDSNLQRALAKKD